MRSSIVEKPFSRHWIPQAKKMPQKYTTPHPREIHLLILLYKLLQKRHSFYIISFILWSTSLGYCANQKFSSDLKHLIPSTCTSDSFGNAMLTTSIGTGFPITLPNHLLNNLLFFPWKTYSIFYSSTFHWSDVCAKSFLFINPNLLKWWIDS